jgi:hypothetical protein
MQDELVSQMFSGPLQLVLVSTAGVLQLQRRRPVDVLQALLQVRPCCCCCCVCRNMQTCCGEGIGPLTHFSGLLSCGYKGTLGGASCQPTSVVELPVCACLLPAVLLLTVHAGCCRSVLLQERSPEKLQQFFEAYGAPEAAAMCYLLATAENQSMVRGRRCCVLRGKRKLGMQRSQHKQQLLVFQGSIGSFHQTSRVGVGAAVFLATCEPTTAPCSDIVQVNPVDALCMLCCL